MGFQVSRRFADGPFRLISTTFLLMSVLTVQLAMLTEGASAHTGGAQTLTTSLGSAPNPSVFGQTATFTATANCAAGCHNPALPHNPSISVQFLDGVTPMGTSSVGNNTSSQTTPVVSAILQFANLIAGAHSITAVFTPADPDFTASNASAPQTVNKAATNIPFISSTPSPPVANQPVTFTATVTVNPPGAGTPTGTVTFTVDGVPHTATLNGNTASFPTTLGGGPHTVTATYNGDPNFAQSNTAQLVVTPGAVTTTTTVSSSANPSAAGQPVTFTATLTGAGAGTPTGAVTFTVDGTPQPSVNLSGNTASFTTTGLTVGSHIIRVSYGGDLNFAGSTSSPLTQNVGIGPTTTTLASSANPSSVGQSVTFTAVVAGTAGTGTPTGTVSFVDSGVPIGTATLVGNSATFTTLSLTLGSHPITAKYLGSAAFAMSTSQVLLQAVNTPADSLKLRALQLAGTKIEAQSSGQAMSGAIGAAITEGFSENGNLITPSGDGLHFNFAAEPHEKGVAPAEARERVGTPFDALGYGPNVTKAPSAVVQPRDWLFWMDLRGTGWDNRQTGADVQGTQVNTLWGVTRKFSPDLLLGIFGGFESFNYTSEALTGHLKGDGWTAGGYFGWRLLPGHYASEAAAPRNRK